MFGGFYFYTIYLSVLYILKAEFRNTLDIFFDYCDIVLKY